MNGKYNIILKSQLGPKPGTLFIKATHRRLWGSLNILGSENILVGVHDKDGFQLKGRFRTALGLTKCVLIGRFTETNELKATITIDNKDYEITGTITQ